MFSRNTLLIVVAAVLLILAGSSLVIYRLPGTYNSVRATLGWGPYEIEFFNCIRRFGGGPAKEHTRVCVIENAIRIPDDEYEFSNHRIDGLKGTVKVVNKSRYYFIFIRFKVSDPIQRNELDRELLYEQRVRMFPRETQVVSSEYPADEVYYPGQGPVLDVLRRPTYAQVYGVIRP